MLRPRSRAGALLALALVALLGVPAVGAEDDAAGCAGARVDGSWIATDLPLEGTRRLLVPDRLQPGVLYAGDDTRLLGTGDAGCTWRELFVAPEDQRLQAATLTPTGRLVLATVSSVGGSSSPRTWEADAAAERPAFRDTSAGLPPAGTPRALTSAADGTPLLALEPVVARPAATAPTAPGAPEPEDLTAPVTARLYASGGDGWTPLRARGLDLPVDDLAGDPASPRVVWAAAGGQLLRSTDAASSFSRVDARVGRVAALTAPAPDVLAVVGDAAAAVTRNGARTVSAAPSGAGSLIAARTDDDSLLVATTAGRLLRVDPANRGAVDVTPPSGAQPRALAAAGGRRGGRPGSYLVATDTSLLRARPPATRDTVDPRPDAPVVVDPGTLSGPAAARRGTLTPERQEVTLAAGTSTTVPLTLTMPPLPTPVDLFFLVDTSDSMTPVLDDLRDNVTSLVERLTAQGVSLHVGLAVTGTERRDGALDPPADPLDPDYRPPVQYRLLHPVGPPDAAFAKALASLRAETTPPGSARRFNQLAGLWQALSGSGIAGPPGADVPPGGSAGWRAGSVRRVLVDATDTSLRADVTRGTPARDGRPAPELVADELRRQRVAHLGLVLDNQPELAADLGDLSRATGAVAGPAGVDCDGDGGRDLAAGAPLVCVTTDGFTAGVGAALAALPDLADLAVTAAGPAVGGTGPLVARRIDVLAPAPVPFAVPVSCAASGTGTGRVDVTARLAEVPLAAARIDVRCLPVAAAAAVPVAQPEAAAPAPPPPAAPAPVAAVVQPAAPPPPAQPAGQPQPLGQNVAQPAAAAQEDEQVELALAGVGLNEDEDLLPAENGPPNALAPFAAGLVTAAAGWAAMRRPAPVAAARG